ncbi:bifunctional diaminohydroxyphosphoribosylaminopyrimidine deaminase/5-amino-6-(5-phosphoribosylamino)uracil reductase RibD [Alicyclobacillus tolerans]|uniref:bifunctional diaminohydroxyphosphoribosylaminopyrimidine deaminase/5-amino-6-(5-phosphoribosylamino)uracil reductase RibD n=1 Tax=Alicyclobacillus tolerans TaxID=90970 RepID=UPI003B7F00B8
MDEFFMNLAYQLALTVDGQTSPNPPVGSVITKNGRVIGIGAHLKAGTEHAEIHALKSSVESVNNATIYVTLEPCSHFGKTPPCANAIIEAGITRVVVGAVDPNPKVSGDGIKVLRENGIQVDMCTLEDRIERLYQPFTQFILKQEPFVLVKSAITLDGKIASSSGQSKWISSSTSRELAHRLRNKCDAILVGIGTIIADNPSLTTRLHGGGKNPLRVVIDRNLRIPLESKVIQDTERSNTLVVTDIRVEDRKIQQLNSLGVQTIQFDFGEEEWLVKLLKSLAARGIIRLLVEGGQHITTLFFDKQRVNEIHLFMAPKLIGGKDSYSIIGGEGISIIDSAIRIVDMNIEQCEEDLYIRGTPVWI